MMMVIFAGLLSGYGVYGHFLGGIDGLTPLPEDYWPPTGPPDFNLMPPTRRNVAEEMLKRAFGHDCDELRRINKLEIPARHMVLAVDKFRPIREEEGDQEELGEALYKEHLGQVLLSPFSVAIFGKDGEINTIRSKQAFLKFDRPIASISEIGRAKIVAAELRKGIVIVNNRRTPRLDDDLSLSTDGPLYYDESKHLIYTDRNAVVYLKDTQSKPEPNTVTAVGMDLELTPPEANKSKPPPSRKNQHESISGVDRITLRSVVQMDLYVDPRSGFMSVNAGAQTVPSGPAGQKSGTRTVPGSTPTAKDKDHVQITTQGPFTYDVHKDFARFDISHKPTSLPSRVHVTRRHLETGNRDDLDCDRLDLQFQRKEAPPGQAPPSETEDRAVSMEIESAEALQTQGDSVEIVSYEEVFNASCHRLRYDSRTKKTTLWGNAGKSDINMVAMKDGNMILAPELQLISADTNTPQQVIAKGPGQIDMTDKATGNKTLHAYWKDLLTSTKDGTYDCLILTGDAAFKDDGPNKDDPGNVQELRADRIKVWLEPSDPAGKLPAKAPSDQHSSVETQQRLRPHHLEAMNRVRLRSPEMIVEKADKFVIWFKDAPERDLMADGPPRNVDEKTKIGPKAGSTNDFATSENTGKDKPSTLVSHPIPAKGNSGIGQPAPTNPESTKPKKPLKLEARDIKAHVLRAGNRNDLESLECQGRVRVKQEPATPEDKGVDIRGDFLQLNHFLDGNVLLVTGNPQTLAWVQLDKLTIQGKEVNIDQRANRSWVNDIGVMQMLTTTDFEGNKLANPTQVTIHWNKEMQFDGKTAFFSGGVTAEQNNSRLQCQEMQVDLDRPVSFKEGERNGPPAKVEHLVCDRRQGKEPVMVEDTKYEGSKVIAYQILRAQEVHVNNKEDKMEAPGPGILNLLQLGTADDDPLSTPPPKKGPQSKPAPRGKEELQLTRVIYAGTLHADNKQRIATFYDDVEVYHGPSDDPNLKIDKAHLPPGFMHLQCKMLKVLTEPLPNGQKNQKMQATGQVRIRSNDYWGDAQIVKFDESDDRIILDGGTGMAHLYRVLAPGAKPDKVEGHKISYNRKTKLYTVDGGNEIQVH
jgi:lipopolysaccharide export system protein LptA